MHCLLIAFSWLTSWNRSLIKHTWHKNYVSWELYDQRVSRQITDYLKCSKHTKRTWLLVCWAVKSSSDSAGSTLCGLSYRGLSETISPPCLSNPHFFVFFGPPPARLDRCSAAKPRKRVDTQWEIEENWGACRYVHAHTNTYSTNPREVWRLCGH